MCGTDWFGIAGDKSKAESVTVGPTNKPQHVIVRCSSSKIPVIPYQYPSTVFTTAPSLFSSSSPALALWGFILYVV
jgi:hypothetical protein